MVCRSLLSQVTQFFVGFSLLSLGHLGAQAQDDDILELESFVVVGSRIEGVDANTPSPVLVLNRNRLDEMGFTSIADVVRNLSFNTGNTIGMEGAATGFSAGVSSINLRGLGNNNTLVLINGRRSSPAGGSAFNGFQTVFDFNSVPLALVESMQILKDAGSGIYGSDAVAGVVAIDLVRRFSFWGQASSQCTPSTAPVRRHTCIANFYQAELVRQ